MRIGSATVRRLGGMRPHVAEAVAAGLLMSPPVLATLWGNAPPLLPTAVCLVAWIVWRDATRYLIPDAAVVALGILGILSRVQTPIFAFDASVASLSLLIDVLLAGGGVWLVREAYFRRRGHDGIGLGDVKLAAAGGLLCGLEGFSMALLSASVIGLAAAFVALRLGFDEIGRKLPFGALLAPAMLLIWILQS